MQIKKVDNYQFYYRPDTADEIQLRNDNTMFLIPEYDLKQNDTIFDIGAHIGTFTVPTSSKVPRGKIFAIEARKETFEILKKNVEINKVSNVSVHHLALTDFKGETKLYIAPHRQNWGDSITNVSDEYEIVKANTLTNYMVENKIEHCNFMKINCEGAEFEIILSSPKETLRKIKLMLILYHCDFNKNHTEKELIKYLKKCGFKTSIRDRKEKRGWIIARRK
ncbi:FkbM family methyltransferase [Spirochaetota bacterium]